MVSKILVQRLTAEGKTLWKRYPVDPNSKVLIKQGGIGQADKKWEPTLRAINKFKRRKSSYFIWEDYVIYPDGAKEFLSHGDEVLPAFSMDDVNKILDNRIFSGLRSAMKSPVSPLILYLILGGVGFVIFLLMGGGDIIR